MTRFSLFLSILLCLFFKASAQQPLNTFFLLNSGLYINNPDSADYIRVVYQPEEGSALYPVREFYKNGTKKTIGFSSRVDPPSYEGYLRSYYPNGNKQQIANFSKGQTTDSTYNYYPNGNLYTISVSKPATTPGYTELRIEEVRDSTGKELAIHGDGDYFIYNQISGKTIEHGPIKNGVRDGVWVGEKTDTTDRYTEVYANGKLISGESIDDQNVPYKYTSITMSPEFKGGQDRFYSYLNTHLHYPERSRRLGIGRIVHVAFTVEKDGTLTGFSETQSMNSDLDEEAIRVIKRSPKWEPGRFRGKPIRSRALVPIKFSLSSR